MTNLKLYDINLFGLILEYTTNEEFSRLYQDKEIKNYIHNNEWLLKNKSNIKIFKSDKIYEKGKIKNMKFRCNQGKCKSLAKNLYYHKNFKCNYRIIKCSKGHERYACLKAKCWCDFKLKINCKTMLNFTKESQFFIKLIMILNPLLLLFLLAIFMNVLFLGKKIAYFNKILVIKLILPSIITISGLIYFGIYTWNPWLDSLIFEFFMLLEGLIYLKITKKIEFT